MTHGHWPVAASQAWRALREEWQGKGCVWLAKLDGSGVSDYLEADGGFSRLPGRAPQDEAPVSWVKEKPNEANQFEMVRLEKLPHAFWKVSWNALYYLKNGDRFIGST